MSTSKVLLTAYFVSVVVNVPFGLDRANIIFSHKEQRFNASV